jgi:YidC/Oxa1 family membrane protein insertase
VRADEPSSQDGLPPELRIADTPPLADQLQQLLLLRSQVQTQQGSQKGGFLSGIFGGGEKKPLSVAQLVEGAASLKGALVAVDGVYTASSEKDTGVFKSEGGECKIALGGGTVPTGFPEAGPNGLPAHAEGLVEVDASGKPIVRASKLEPSLPLTLIRMARVDELQGKWMEAAAAYKEVAAAGQRSGFWLAPQARFWAGVLEMDMLRERKAAQGDLWMAWQTYSIADPSGKPRFYVWRPTADGKAWEKVSVREALHEPLDAIARNNFWYKFVDFFVGVCGGNAGLGILLIALVVRVGIYPLTIKQMQSGKAMQKLQPQIKALQQEYKDDKQKFQEEFWKLCKANHVNPFGGCLPLVVQMPILICIYQGIRSYIIQFDGHSFLWVHNLSQPDMVLLVMYTLSMIAFQKMTSKMQPTMDPQQAQQQQMMTYMMPLMFFMFFKTMSSAFILYWLGTNVIYFAQQWLYMRDAHAPAGGAGTDGALIPSEPAPKPKSTGFAAIMDALAGKKPAAPEEPAKPQSYEQKVKSGQGKKSNRAEAESRDTKRRKR